MKHQPVSIFESAATVLNLFGVDSASVARQIAIQMEGDPCGVPGDRGLRALT